MLTMAEDYSFVEDIEEETWNNINEAKGYIKYAAALVGTRLRQGTHKAGHLVYKCSYDVCAFCIMVTRTFEHSREVWRCRADPAQHNGHEVRVPPKIVCNRPACSQWVWQQVLSFRQISARMVNEPEDPQPTGITVNRPINLQPMDLAGRHIHIDRCWVNTTGGGYKALSVIFNWADAFQDIAQYVLGHRQAYKHFYGWTNCQYGQDVFAALRDDTVPMLFDMAQFMVDLTQTALVLVQVEEDEEEAEDMVPVLGEVNLLVP